MPLRGVRLSDGTVAVSLAGPADAAELLAFHQRNQDHLAPWLPPVPDDFLTLGHWRRWAAAAETLYAADQAVRLVIRRAGDTPVIGQINLSQIQRGPFQACYVGYHIDREAEGRGLMRRAMELAIRFAFDELGLHRIMANYLPTNERSARLLQRLGFEIEGYARAYLFIGGAWRDHVLTALLNPRARTPATDSRRPNG